MNREFSIETLVGDLAPVRPVRAATGIALTLGATALAVLAVALSYGLRADIVAGSPHPLAIIRSGILLLVGTSCLIAVAGSARPYVGQRHEGWRWALAAALLAPLAALGSAASGATVAESLLSPASGRSCLQISLIAAFGIAVPLTLWLRRGAATDPERAGWLVGLAAGGFGTFAYSLYCPMLNIYYVGLWYTLAVGLAAVAGRLIITQLIRW